MMRVENKTVNMKREKKKKYVEIKVITQRNHKMFETTARMNMKTDMQKIFNNDLIYFFFFDFILYVPVNNLSVILGRVFLG